MPELLLVGGAPRIGKSYVAEAVMQRQACAHLSTDAMRETIRGCVEGDELETATAVDDLLFEQRNFQALQNDPARVIEMQDEESALVWQKMLPFIRHETNTGNTLLIEGVAVVPALIAVSGIAHRAVFVGNQSEEHAVKMVEAAQANPGDWMNLCGLALDEMSAVATFTRAFSAHLQREAEAHGYPYIEMSDSDFYGSVSRAADMVCSKIELSVPC